MEEISKYQTYHQDELDTCGICGGYDGCVFHSYEINTNKLIDEEQYKKRIEDYFTNLKEQGE